MSAQLKSTQDQMKRAENDKLQMRRRYPFQNGKSYISIGYVS